nr:hypothetical protein [Tanacetum cinerariifolium]
MDPVQRVWIARALIEGTIQFIFLFVDDDFIQLLNAIIVRYYEVCTFEALLGGDNSYPLSHNVVLILLMKPKSVSWFLAVTATDAAAVGDAFCCFQSRYSSVCLIDWVMLLLVVLMLIIRDRCAGLLILALLWSCDFYRSLEQLGSSVVSAIVFPKHCCVLSGLYMEGKQLLKFGKEVGGSNPPGSVTKIEVSCQRCKWLVSETFICDIMFSPSKLVVSQVVVIIIGWSLCIYSSSTTCCMMFTILMRSLDLLGGLILALLWCCYCFKCLKSISDRLLLWLLAGYLRDFSSVIIRI